MGEAHPILKLERFVETAARGVRESNREQLRHDALVLLEEVHAELVDLCMRDDQQDQGMDYFLRYGFALFGMSETNRSTANLRESFERFLMIIKRMHTMLMTLELLPLPIDESTDTSAPAKHIKTLLDKITSNVNSFYQIVQHNVKIQYLSESQSRTAEPFESLFLNIPDDKKLLADQHKLTLFALHELGKINARRFENWVMVPIETPLGHNTTAYKRKCTIDDFLPNLINRQEHYDIWLIYTSRENIGGWTTKILKLHKHPEFPELVRSRTRFAFNNGIYDAEEDVFRPYVQLPTRGVTVGDALNSAMDEEQSANDDVARMTAWNFGNTITEQERHLMDGFDDFNNKAACMYFDQDLSDMDWDDPMEIPTEALDLIFQAQRLDSEENGGSDLLGWIYALMGRMLYEVGSKDDWQIAPFFKGVAGTGKSTILKVIRMFYDHEDVGVLSNTIEPQFGLAPLVNRMIVLCFEMRSDFRLPQADLQSIMSGEPMSLARKFQEPLPNVKWGAPLAVAGNMIANWSDGQGAIARRWVVIEFAHKVEHTKSDLLGDIKRELPRILVKCNRLYKQKVAQSRGMGPWEVDETGQPVVLPAYFHRQKDVLTRGVNSIISFVLDSGLFETLKGEDKDDGTFHIKWAEFTKRYMEYCKRTSSTIVRLDSLDHYGGALYYLRLKLETCVRMDLERSEMCENKWLLGIKLRHGGSSS